jgi:crotonobetainyl-CoA:carnitine CoA-transferase CaiB-like acyl-CoA transferase
MTQPLEGIQVIDLTQVELGPVCTQALGDFGADVIKIERAGVGDLSRSAYPDPAGQDNPVYLSLNRNKRSLALDLRQPAGRQVLYDLVARADIIVNNFRPGVMDRMGLGYEKLKEINPGLIYAFGSGFGSHGPYAGKGGQDVLAQALSGAMNRRADPSIPLSIYGTALADYAAGMLLVQGILLALVARSRSGEGQQVDVSLFDAMLSMQLQEATVWLMRGKELNWAGYPLSGVFNSQDGALVIVGAFKANPLRDICSALELEDLSERPEFANHEQQVLHKAQIQQIWRERIATRPAAYWIERLDAVDILCAPVATLGEALENPQTAVNEMVWRIPQANREEVVTVGNPVKLSATPASIRRSPPKLGENSEEILRELGYEQGRIEQLRTERVFG